MDKEDEKEVYEEISKISSNSLKMKLAELYKIFKSQEAIDKFYRKEHTDIRFDYETKCQVIYDKISAIVKGEAPVTLEDLQQGNVEKYSLKTPEAELEKGVPEFWKQAILNSKYFDPNEKDEEILSKLADVKMEIKQDKNSFAVHFHFSENVYFSQQILSKTFWYNEETDLTKVESTEVQWNSDKLNPTKKLIKKKKKKGGEKKVVEEFKEVESFFSIFKANLTDETKNHAANKEADDEDEPEHDISTEEQEADFWRDDFIPNAFEYYMDIIDDMDFDDEEEEEEDDDEDEDSAKAKKHKKKQTKDKVSSEEAEKKCKNQ